KAAVKPKISISKDPKLQTLTATIVKTSNGSTSKYGTAHFTIKVTNSGNVKLTAVTVQDALSPDCSRKNLGTLLPSASSSYPCTLTNVKRNFTNVAIAS